MKTAVQHLGENWIAYVVAIALVAIIQFQMADVATKADVAVLSTEIAHIEEALRQKPPNWLVDDVDQLKTDIGTTTNELHSIRLELERMNGRLAQQETAIARILERRGPHE